jgi:hypothetical protein
MDKEQIFSNKDYDRTFIISFGALLEADGKISDEQMSGGARETAVLACACTGFARIVARPAHAALVREAAGRTSAHTRAAWNNTYS